MPPVESQLAILSIANGGNVKGWRLVPQAQERGSTRGDTDQFLVLTKMCVRRGRRSDDLNATPETKTQNAGCVVTL